MTENEESEKEFSRLFGRTALVARTITVYDGKRISFLVAGRAQRFVIVCLLHVRKGHYFTDLSVLDFESENDGIEFTRNIKQDHADAIYREMRKRCLIDSDRSLSRKRRRT